MSPAKKRLGAIDKKAGAAGIDDPGDAGDAQHEADRHAEEQKNEEDHENGDHTKILRLILVETAEIPNTRKHDLDAGEQRRDRHGGVGDRHAHAEDHGELLGAGAGHADAVDEEEREKGKGDDIEGEQEGFLQDFRKTIQQHAKADMFPSGDAGGDREKGSPNHQIACQFLGPGDLNPEHVTGNDPEPDIGDQEHHEQGDHPFDQPVQPRTEARCFVPKRRG